MVVELTALFVAIGSFFVGAMKIINWFSTKKIMDALKQNTEEHKSIFELLESVKGRNAQMNLLESVRNVAKGYMRIAPDERLKTFIDLETERIVDFIQEIITECWTEEIAYLAEVKIHIAKENAQKDSLRILGENYTIAFKIVQHEHLIKLIAGIHRLATDKVVNRKYERFRNVMETFTHDHLVGIIQLYIATKVKEQ